MTRPSKSWATLANPSCSKPVMYHVQRHSTNMDDVFDFGRYERARDRREIGRVRGVVAPSGHCDRSVLTKHTLVINQSYQFHLIASIDHSMVH